MILFLIEIFVLGCAIAVHFREKIADSFLSFLAILLGLFGYFITVVILALFRIGLSVQIVSILMGVEIAVLLILKWTISRKTFFHFKKSNLWYLASGLFFILGSIFFFRAGYVYASPDSLYLIIMSRNILQTGLTEWYFSSPIQWGVFVPIIQIIGQFFGYEYTWFIQPIISFTFLIIFGLAIIKASRDLTTNRILPYAFAFLGIGLIVSSNLPWLMQFYIHTNLDTGMSFFLVVASLYFAIREKNDAWLGITGIFIILLGLTRPENLILAALVIVLTLGTRQISHRKLLWTFLPYLVFQITWNLVMIRINPVAFSNIMSISQLRLATIGLVALTVFLIIAGNRWVWDKILPLINPLIVVGIGILLVGVFVLDPEKTFLDTWDNVQTMFVTGKWYATFWGVVPLLLLVRVRDRGIRDKLVPFFNILILAFFSMVVILGYFKGSYRSYWYDSANRMYFHILPIMIFYLGVKISSNSSVNTATDRLE